MTVQVVERDFTKTGRMNNKLPPEDAARIKGHLPFYSVDTKEEVDALIELALRSGEFYRQGDGALVERTLAYEQTVENLQLAGERLQELHEQLNPDVVRTDRTDPIGDRPMTQTSRKSPPCPGTGTVIPAEEIPGHEIVDCPSCGRPMRVSQGIIKRHGTVTTRNTEAADQRLLDYRRSYELTQEAS